MGASDVDAILFTTTPKKNHGKGSIASRCSPSFRRSLRRCAIQSVKDTATGLCATGQPPLRALPQVKAVARLDVKFVVRSNDDTLKAEDLDLGYKQLQRVEEAWRALKADCAYKEMTKI